MPALRASCVTVRAIVEYTINLTPGFQVKAKSPNGRMYGSTAGAEGLDRGAARRASAPGVLRTHERGQHVQRDGGQRDRAARGNVELRADKEPDDARSGAERGRQQDLGAHRAPD